MFIQVGPAFPSWIDTLSKLFPVRHFADLIHMSWDPRITSVTFDPVPWVVIGIWFVIGVVVSIRYFSWEPRT